jgi:ADP-ribose pyrophosphatase
LRWRLPAIFFYSPTLSSQKSQKSQKNQKNQKNQKIRTKNMTSPKTTETLYTGKIVSLELQDSRWEIVRHAPAVAVVAMREGKILLVKQERRAVGTHTLEVPAGLIDPGETPLEAAQRELSEECNLGGTLELICRYIASPGFCDEEIFLFAATDLFENPGTPDEDEEIEVLWLEPSTVLAGMKSGEIVGSSTTIAGCLWALTLG